ncbi:hypothetical protein P4O66_000869, partial [Electrophorus voltai]
KADLLLLADFFDVVVTCSATKWEIMEVLEACSGQEGILPERGGPVGVVVNLTQGMSMVETRDDTVVGSHIEPHVIRFPGGDRMLALKLKEIDLEIRRQEHETKPRPSDLNDYRPVAITSVVMKCFEKLVRDFITSSLPASMDPLQFAYRHNRSTDDAIAHLLHTTLTHLDEGRGNYVKMLFVDYSSAFNTVIPSLLTTKLGDLGVHTSLCNWISNFLTDRPQSVRVGNCTSSTLTLSTGAPQGCVLSPLLYSLYTHDCTATSSSTIIGKFADDTVVMGLISDNDERAYLEEIKHLENWCQENNLLLNISKTKELIVDCSKKQERHYQPDLSWSRHTNSLGKKACQRLYHLRHLRDFRLPSKTIYYKRCQTKARRIVKDPTHPNNRLFSLLSFSATLGAPQRQSIPWDLGRPIQYSWHVHGKRKNLGFFFTCQGPSRLHHTAVTAVPVEPFCSP